MRYSENFERDFKWYLSMRHKFNFSGRDDLVKIKYDKNGVSGKQAFLKYDSTGEMFPTKHPNLLHTLLKAKGSVNLHIKMYAEDRVSGLLNKSEFEQMCDEFKAPTWFYDAVENQKVKLYK